MEKEQTKICTGIMISLYTHTNSKQARRVVVMAVRLLVEVCIT